MRPCSRQPGSRGDHACRTAREDVRAGLTLIELMVAVAILVVLFGLVVMASKLTRDASRRSTAQQQLALLSTAIDQYAAAWPTWKVGTTVVADKGWPDFIPGRLFGAPYSVVAGFNDFVDLNNPPAGADVVLNANDTLAYCLTSSSGGGPYLKDKAIDLLTLVRRGDGQAEFYPSLPGAGALQRQRLVDPWGTPYRYFWVYRNANAYRGWLPVTTADSTDPRRPKAEGFVLESAGPDRKYGNVWTTNVLIQPQNIVDAEDNLVISP